MHVGDDRQLASPVTPTRNEGGSGGRTAGCAVAGGDGQFDAGLVASAADAECIDITGDKRVDAAVFVAGGGPGRGRGSSTQATGGDPCGGPRPRADHRQQSCPLALSEPDSPVDRYPPGLDLVR